VAFSHIVMLMFVHLVASDRLCVTEALDCLTDCPESPAILLFCYRQTWGSFCD